MSDPRPKSKARGNAIRRRPISNQPRSENKPAINPIKKRIRDLNRLLEHKDSLPADVRLNYERELSSCKYDVENAERARNRSRMIQKYHMVRFFGEMIFAPHETPKNANTYGTERKRATKLLKRERAQLSQEATADERKTLEASVHACEVDLNYTIYYPLHMVYTSLYASEKVADKAKQHAKNKHNNEGGSAKRDGIMWRVVEQAMASGRLQDLREGRLEGYRDNVQSAPSDRQSQAGSRSKSSSTRPKPSSVENDVNIDGGDNDDSDGDGAGFFE